SIPWHLPEDFKWFKQTTLGHTLVMGRKTFESIGRPLPSRSTIVLSRTPFQFPGTRWAPSLSDIHPDQEPGEVFICGGGQVYRDALPLCSNLFLTVVKQTVEGDVLFPELDSRWELVTIVRETPEFDIQHWRNNGSLPEGAC
ncbi:MAG: dihydrofolate reductase, partial [Verrucomicrobia bacterium]|nr:dihydrofolate reductase [Verrucomicrobiota bacterium]